MSGRAIAMLAALLGATCLGLLGCRSRVSDLNEEALAHLRRGDLSTAVLLLEQASQLAPTRHEVFLNLAEAYRRQGRLEAALEAIEAAGRLAPRRPGVVAARAKLYLLAGQPGPALAQLEGVDAKVRAEPEVRFYHGLLLVENGRAGEAVPLLEEFVRRYPRVAAGHAALGWAHLRLGNHTEGKQQIELALRRDPALLDARLYLAQHYLVQVQDYRRAKEELYVARGHDPGDPRVHLLLGQTNLALQLLNEADRAFEQAIRLNSDAWMAYLGMAETALRRGNAEQALSFAKHAKDKAPEQPKVYNFLARLYTQRQQTSLAIQAYEESLKRDANQPAIREALATLKAS